MPPAGLPLKKVAGIDQHHEGCQWLLNLLDFSELPIYRFATRIPPKPRHRIEQRKHFG